MIKEENEGRFDDVIIGKNAVKEALKSGRPADRLIIERGEHKILSPRLFRCARIWAFP